MAELALRNINKVYDSDVHAVKNFNLEVNKGEFVVFVGPSGCGKTTTLRMIAGLEDITSGSLLIDEKTVNDVPSKDRDIAMVFQSYALYPHLSVYDNIAFSLSVRKVSKPKILQKVLEASKILGLDDLLERKPKTLSGGQKQRVAMGRAIVREPKIFLMDEPLSNLDAKLRVQMRAEIAKLHKRLQTTIVYVTHDQVEAMTLGDRIVVMKDGVIMQADTPENLYNKPANTFVAGFIGTPAMNFVDSGLFPEIGVPNAILGVRAEDIHIMPCNVFTEDINIERGEVLANVESKEMHGADTFVNLTCGNQNIVARVSTAMANQIRISTQAAISINLEKVHLFDKDTQQRIP